MANINSTKKGPNSDQAQPDNMPKLKGLNRRDFFKLIGGGIAVALTYDDLLATDSATLSVKQQLADEETIAAWIHIDDAGLINVFTGKVEVGQNIRTSLSQVVAEELLVPVSSIEMIMGDTSLTPYDRGTFGSRTTPFMGPQLRIAAASLREALINMAAEQWRVSPQKLQAKDSQVIHTASGRSIAYAEISKGRKILLPLNKQIALKPSDEWSIAGTSVPKINGKSFISGKHQYVSDMVLPGMLYGKVLRAPAYGASLIAVDTSLADQLPNITVVKEDDFVGITAPDPQLAENALAKINAEWRRTDQPSRPEIFEYLKRRAKESEGEPKNTGSAQGKAVTKWKRRFEVQYIAHVPLEPRAGVAKWEEGQLTVWTGTQRPFGVQEELANAFNMPKDKIRVIMPDTGSGYGGKHSGEAGVEAARLSKAVGRPVKVLWSREEEFKWAYFRPAGLIEASVEADENNRITSWEFHNYNSGNAGIEVPYEIENKHIQYHPSTSPLPQGSYRGLAATANVFAIETLINDVAIQAKEDPLAFRISHLKDERLKAVLIAAADNFKWNTTEMMEPFRGQGIACGFVKNAYVATCVEVIYDKTVGLLKIERIVAAFDCGAIINPKHLENQVMGCILQGLGGALFEEVDFKEGRILNPSISTYRLPRFADIPPIEIVLLDRKDLPSSGAGETPIVAIAPAIRNAIHQATGKQLYNLPLIPKALKL